MIDEKIEKKIQKVGDLVQRGDIRVYNIPSNWVTILYPEGSSFKVYVTDVTISKDDIFLDNENIRVASIPRSNIQKIKILSETKDKLYYNEANTLRKIYMRNQRGLERD